MATLISCTSSQSRCVTFVFLLQPGGSFAQLSVLRLKGAAALANWC
jgi:hypothetical protein